MRGFLLKNAWKDVRRNKFTSGVLFGICLISILASLAAGNLAWSLWRQYAVSHMTDAKQEYIAEFFVKEKNAEMACFFRHSFAPFGLVAFLFCSFRTKKNSRTKRTFAR